MNKNNIILSPKLYLKLIEESWKSGYNRIPLKEILKIHIDGLQLEEGRK